MKILHLIRSLNPAKGGTVEGLRLSSIAIQAEGHAVDILTLDQPGASWLKDFPTTVHALGTSLSTYGYSPHLLPWLRANAKNYDAIVINGIWQYQSFGAWRALRRCGIPYFVFTHGMLDPWFRHTYPLKHIKKWLYWPWADYRVLRDADAVLFTCEEERVLARQSFWLYQCKEIVVGYGTAAPIGDPDSQRETFLQENPSLRGKRLFLFLGRIHKKKGCDILIEAFSHIASRDPSLHLVIAGPDQTGWQRELVEQSNLLGIGGRISWLGMISGDMKWGAYHAAEVFVLPSHQENFGIVVAEALACGVPVLISNKVNIWREIAADGAGIVVEDDLPGTITALESWLTLTDEKRNAMRQIAEQTFLTRYEMTTSVKKLIELFGKFTHPNSRHQSPLANQAPDS